MLVRQKRPGRGRQLEAKNGKKRRKGRGSVILSVEKTADPLDLKVKRLGPGIGLVQEAK